MLYLIIYRNTFFQKIKLNNVRREHRIKIHKKKEDFGVFFFIFFITLCLLRENEMLSC